MKYKNCLFTERLHISSHADPSFLFSIKYYSARYHFPLVCIYMCDHEVIQNKRIPVRIHYFNKVQYLHSSLSLTPVWGASHMQKRVIFLCFACFALHLGVCAPWKTLKMPWCSDHPSLSPARALGSRSVLYMRSAAHQKWTCRFSQIY